ncbi:transcription factor SPT20 homolog isoform X2 [Phymastichus coffea]|uniref:transcription factor SPT20 homolog isoform X2 n=1 Tax=Phymastichus coffea TaxID=108790 RepID=UPI00273C3605|nr:transcription factor SPT20 homolog isoform X2 [Phymastichus coffea]
MNIGLEENDSFDLSGDFNDAPAAEREYTDGSNDNNYNNPTIQQEMCITSECFIQEGDQNILDIEQLMSDQPQIINYQQQFQNQNSQSNQQQHEQQQQQTFAYPQHFQNLAPQSYQEAPQIHDQAVLAGQFVPHAPQLEHQTPQLVPQPLHLAPQATQYAPQATQLVPQTPHLAPQATQYAPQATQLVPQTAHLAPQPTQYAPQATQLVPQTPHLAPQHTQFAPQAAQFVPQATQFAPQVPHHTPQVPHHTPHVSQLVPQVAEVTSQDLNQAPQIHNQTAQAGRVVPQASLQTMQVRQGASQLEKQAAETEKTMDCLQQRYLAQRAKKKTVKMTPEQQRLLTAYQNMYQRPTKTQNQQQPQPQGNVEALAPSTSAVGVSQDANSMPPPQPQDSPDTTDQQMQSAERTSKKQSKPYIEIVEQPAPRASRFRYNCEVRSMGSIPGVHSTPTSKTYPTIRIVDYKGTAVIVVSCVTKDKPYRAHPHNLVGRMLCKNGVCRAIMSNGQSSLAFDRLGIQCIKKKDVYDSLVIREKLKVDPFNNGFQGKENPGIFDQNCVRLAFQAYLEGPAKGQFKIALPPVVSDPIYDKKNSPELLIYRLSHCCAPATGGQDMIILCDKVTKEDIQVRFYEERDDDLVWEAYGDMCRSGAVHKHFAIVFQSPIYKIKEFNEPKRVYIELIRPSDGLCSNSVPFEFIPVNDPIGLKRKRSRLDDRILKHLEQLQQSGRVNQWNIPAEPTIDVVEAH